MRIVENKKKYELIKVLGVLYWFIITFGSEITPCNKIDKPLVVYRFSGTVMTSVTMLRS